MGDSDTVLVRERDERDLIFIHIHHYREMCFLYIYIRDIICIDIHHVREIWHLYMYINRQR